MPEQTVEQAVQVPLPLLLGRLLPTQAAVAVAYTVIAGAQVVQAVVAQAAQEIIMALLQQQILAVVAAVPEQVRVVMQVEMAAPAL
jgi:hypothetical protein